MDLLGFPHKVVFVDFPLSMHPNQFDNSLLGVPRTTDETVITALSVTGQVFEALALKLPDLLFDYTSSNLI